MELNFPQYMASIAGFSFGGLLALSLAASLWNLPYISADRLKEDFVCITFGQPLISLPAVQEVTEECPEFQSIVHSIFTKADLVPQLMKFLDQKCEEQCAQILLTSSLKIHAGVIPKSRKVSTYIGNPDFHALWNCMRYSCMIAYRQLGYSYYGPFISCRPFKVLSLPCCSAI